MVMQSSVMDNGGLEGQRKYLITHRVALESELLSEIKKYVLDFPF